MSLLFFTAGFFCVFEILTLNGKYTEILMLILSFIFILSTNFGVL